MHWTRLRPMSCSTGGHEHDPFTKVRNDSFTGTKRPYSFGHSLLIIEIIHSNLASRIFNHGDEVPTTHWFCVLLFF
jgi:hypothetical protein